MKARAYVGLGAAALVGVVTINVVDELVVDTWSNDWQLGYNYAATRASNPLKGVPEESLPAVSERAAEACEEVWETPESAGGPDAGGPDYEDFCAGEVAGYADRLRGTYVRFEEASWNGWDGD